MTKEQKVEGWIIAAFVVCVILTLAWVLVFVGNIFHSEMVDVGFRIYDAPVFEVVITSTASCWVDNISAPELTMYKAGFVHLVSGINHTYLIEIHAQDGSLLKSFQGTFYLPNSYPKGTYFIVSISWDFGVTLVEAHSPYELEPIAGR